LADAEVIKTLIDGISPSFASVSFIHAYNLILGLPDRIINNIAELDATQKEKYIADEGGVAC
jgi:hypothetical protein